MFQITQALRVCGNLFRRLPNIKPEPFYPLEHRYRHYGLLLGLLIILSLLLGIFGIFHNPPQEIQGKNKNQPASEKPVPQEPQTTPSGFTYLCENTYTCGKQSYTVKEYRHNLTNMVFILIPGGVFKMGDKVRGRREEMPVHTVTIKSFLMSKYETTQEEWTKFMNFPVDFKDSKFLGRNHPIASVSWYQCQEFCQKTGLRLPTEAEWEYSCASGSTDEWYFDRLQLDEYAWHQDNSDEHTHEVGKKFSNAFGLYDMSGNVWELCQDWYHDGYTNAPSDGSAWENPKSSHRVYRGGSYKYGDLFLRSAHRNYIKPCDLSCNVGVRFACDLK